MTQYDDVVERQKTLLEAEEWAMQVKCVHIHGLQSMWYDDHPEDTKNGKMVTDTEYNCGLIERQQGGKLLRTFGKALKGQELYDHYCRST